MKQRYQEYSHDLAWRAAYSFLDGKWKRNDVLRYLEEFAGIPRRKIYESERTADVNIKLEAADNLACVIEDIVEDILNGRDPDYIDPVTSSMRADGMTGKVRNIANLCIPHQLLGHLAALALEPLFHAKILPTQHASIPGHGQAKLKDQTARYLRSGALDISFIEKTDATQAYASTKYSAVVKILRKEIPRAEWIIKVVEYLGKLAPGGCLIIGGYLDAWLFNLVMSYGLRYALRQGQTRRGKFTRYVSKIEAYMDDCGFMARTKTGVQKAVSAFTKWMDATYGIRIRTTTGIIRILTVEEEKRRRAMERPSQRGCPCLDMGGYRISRTHVTMRPRVAKRVIRALTRAWREICETGTIQRQRVCAVISRYGSIKGSCSQKFKEEYHVDRIMRMARAIASYWGRERSRKRRVWLERAIKRCEAFERKMTGRS